MSTARLPAHLEVGALIRMAEAAGGIATVIAKGERDAGTLLILTVEPDRSLLWERMPRLDGRRGFEVVLERTASESQEFDRYLDRRRSSDQDIWLVELYVANAQRFIAEFSA